MVVQVAPAAAQDLGALADNLSRLERQLQTLERTVYRGDPPPASAAAPATSDTGLPSAAAAQFQIRVDRFEEEMRSLTGQVERLGFDMRQLGDRLDRLVADVDFRLRQLEGGAALPPLAGAQPADGGTTPPAAVAALPPASGDTPIIGGETPLLESGSTVRVIGQLTQDQLDTANAAAAPAPEAPAVDVAAVSGVTLPEGNAQGQYDYAVGFLKQRDFAQAEEAFRQFIAANPSSDLTGNAQYWLGETFYVRQNYQDAAGAFARGFQNYPESSKAPDNLLKLGLSLANLDRRDDACTTFAELNRQYPDAAAIILQRAEQESARLGCT